MLQPNIIELPSEGLKGFFRHWKADIWAGLAVSLNNIPYILSLAFISGLPLQSGLLTVCISGLLLVWLSPSTLSVKGPSTTVTAMLLLAHYHLPTEDTGKLIVSILTSVFMIGIFQVLIGFFRLARFKNLFPDTIVYGLLAACGLMIFSRTLYYIWSDIPPRYTTLHLLLDYPEYITGHLAQIESMLFSLFLLAIVFVPLIFHERFSKSAFLSSVSLIFIVGIAAVNYLDWQQIHSTWLLYLPYHSEKIFAQAYLIDFWLLLDFNFWIFTLTLLTITSLESLINIRSVNALDPYRRIVSNDNEMILIGIGNIIGGIIGAMPMVTTMLRSTGNINNNAHSKWSSFYAALFSLMIYFVLATFNIGIPISILAVIMLYTSYRMLSPRLVRDIYAIGREQLLFFVIAFLIALSSSFLLAIFVSVLVVYFTYWLMGATLRSFFTLELKEVNFGDRITLKIRSDSVASAFLVLEQKLKKLPSNCQVYIDFQKSPLVTYSFMELLYQYEYSSKLEYGIEIQGLDDHVSLSKHPLATRILPSDEISTWEKINRYTEREKRALERKNKPKKRHEVEVESLLSERQVDILSFAASYNVKMRSNIVYDGNRLRSFQFANGFQIKYRENRFKTKYHGVSIEFSDVLLYKGIRMSEQSQKISIFLLSDFPIEIPEFRLERESFLDKLYQAMGFQDVDFEDDKKFSEYYSLVGQDHPIRVFFKKPILQLLDSERIYNIEYKNEKMLVYSRRDVLQKIDIEDAMIFIQNFIDIILEKKSVPDYHEHLQLGLLS
ncbi:MAG: SulP family inorganic anion transporter [Cytophagales bacterium]|nr:MAG: SulP family inorganic anion transporter [Cytophagales bacterium]